MTDHREIELKLEVAGDVAALRTHPFLAGHRARSKAQRTVYYDTQAGALRKAGFSLRVRSSEGRFVQTIKYSRKNGAGLFDRPEWESEIQGPDLDFKLILDTPLADFMTLSMRADLRAMVTCDVDRTIWIVEDGGTEVELNLDEGKVHGGGQERVLRELELELKKGSAVALLDMARALARDVPLRLGVMTKAERGFALADGSLDMVRKADPIRIEPEMSGAESFHVIAHACLKHFRLNEPLVTARRDAAALHQARVAMRRLRSAFSLFGPVIRDDAFERVRDELKWFTDRLGDARNLDVLLKRFEQDADQELIHRLTAARERAYSQISETLDSQRFRDMMLDLLGWLEFGSWRNNEEAAIPIGIFARTRLDRRWRKVRKAGRDLETLDEEPLHRLRIDIKKLRYAVEFLSSLFGKKKKVGAFLDELAEMQEELGFLNDIATARTLFADIVGPNEDLIPPPRPEERARHLAAARKAYDKLAEAGPFWRTGKTGKSD